MDNVVESPLGCAPFHTSKTTVSLSTQYQFDDRIEYSVCSVSQVVFCAETFIVIARHQIAINTIRSTESPLTLVIHYKGVLTRLDSQQRLLCDSPTP